MKILLNSTRIRKFVKGGFWASRQTPSYQQFGQRPRLQGNYFPLGKGSRRKIPTRPQHIILVWDDYQNPIPGSADYALGHPGYLQEKEPTRAHNREESLWGPENFRVGQIR